MNEVPHFASPFSIGRSGAAVVEQGSPENAADNIYNIAVCPQGARLDNPAFGIPQLAYANMPIPLDKLEEALKTYEPDCDLSIEQHREAVAQAGILVAVSV